MKNLIILLSLSAAASALTAQSITNVQVTQAGKTVVITYDLDGKAGDKYTISLDISKDGGKTYLLVPSSVTGDIGKLISSGTNKRIVWDVLKDVEKLVGPDFVFKVKGVSGGGTEFGIEMIFVKGGTFQMGDTFGDGDSNEKPVHTVTVGDFYMSKYEVTQKTWKSVMGNNPSHFSGCDDCPVEQVSWNDAQEFIRKLNQKTGKKYRLPYEAEWEYAARSGGKSEKYSGGANLDAVGWYNGNSGSKTHPVGQKQPNGLGLYDMTGNVWEWCEDWYSDSYYSQSPSYNPKGPGSGTSRVLRGGSWFWIPRFVRASVRFGFIPDGRNDIGGFRLCRLPQ